MGQLLANQRIKLTRRRSPNATVGTPLRTAFDYRFHSPVPAEWVIAGGATDVTIGDAALGERPSSYAARIEAARVALKCSLSDELDVRVAVFAPSGMVAAVGRVGQNEAAVVVGSAQGEGITGIDQFPDYERAYTRQEFATAVR